MTLANWKLVRLCLATGVMTGAVAVNVSAEEAPAGVARIAKPRQRAANAVQQAGFADWAESAGERVESFNQSFNERVYGAPQPTEPIETAEPREPFRFTGFRKQSAAPELVEGEWLVNGPNGECDCPECQGKHGKKWGFKKLHGHGHGYGHGCDVQHGGWPCNSCGYNTGYDMLGYFHSKFGFFCPSGAGGPGSPFFGKYARVYPQDVNHFDGRDGQLFAAQGYGAPMAVPLAPVVGHTYNYGWGVPSSRLTPISHLAPR
jgi:hypothetical protein